LAGAYDGGMETTPRPYQVSLRTLLEVVAAIAVLLAFAYHRLGPQRFHLSTIFIPDNGVSVYMYDSSTGQVWQANGSSWTPFDPLPVTKK
jgi:hypothetical protein